MWQDIDTFLPLGTSNPLTERETAASSSTTTDFEGYNREHLNYYQQQQIHQGYYGLHSKIGELDLRPSVKCEPDSSTINQQHLQRAIEEHHQPSSSSTKDLSEISSSTEEGDSSSEKRQLMSPNSPMSYLQNTDDDYNNSYSSYQQPIRVNNNDVISKECYQTSPSRTTPVTFAHDLSNPMHAQPLPHRQYDPPEWQHHQSLEYHQHAAYQQQQQHLYHHHHRPIMVGGFGSNVSPPPASSSPTQLQSVNIVVPPPPPLTYHPAFHGEYHIQGAEMAEMFQHQYPPQHNPHQHQRYPPQAHQVPQQQHQHFQRHSLPPPAFGTTTHHHHSFSVNVNVMTPPTSPHLANLFSSQSLVNPSLPPSSFQMLM